MTLLISPVLLFTVKRSSLRNALGPRGPGYYQHLLVVSVKRLRRSYETVTQLALHAHSRMPRIGRRYCLLYFETGQHALQMEGAGQKTRGYMTTKGTTKIQLCSRNTVKLFLFPI